MQEGDIALTPLPQADARVKNRPSLILREMLPYGDLLVCGISTQLRHFVPGFDELISPSDQDFESSGLVAASVIRLGYLAVLPSSAIPGSIGSISTDRHERLLRALSSYLVHGQRG